MSDSKSPLKKIIRDVTFSIQYTFNEQEFLPTVDHGQNKKYISHHNNKKGGINKKKRKRRGYNTLLEIQFKEQQLDQLSGFQPTQRRTLSPGSKVQ